MSWAALILAIASFVFSTSNTILFNVKQDKIDKQIEDKFFYKETVDDFVKRHKTEDNPNPYDRIYHKNDSILFYKNGELIESVVRTTQEIE
ncbi:MAG: hypothetical protein LBM25_05035 [Bacteroidales bacterium]|jgi:hypothetical protein|nr:hypothetical protein [Bacteroidales bacterium]